MPAEAAPIVLQSSGVCPICEAPREFVSRHPWLRDHFECVVCKSCPRERALVATLAMFFPNWRALAIHEGSPALQASAKFARECADYTPTQFDRAIPFGSVHPERGYRSEDLERQTFADASFDLVITQDVLEHVFRPDLAVREIARTLKPGGAHVFTVPIARKSRASRRRAVLKTDGTVEHLAPPIYHGNPIDASGALVTIDWGYDIAAYLDAQSGLTTTMVYIDDLSRGIRAEFIEVLVSRKQTVPVL